MQIEYYYIPLFSPTTSSYIIVLSCTFPLLHYCSHLDFSIAINKTSEAYKFLIARPEP